MMNFINKVRNNKSLTPIRLILSLIFPLFAVFCAEATAINNLSNVCRLFFDNISILIFDFIVVGGIYAILTLLIRRVYISSIITGLFFFALSCVEFFRYDGSGIHFSLYDLSLISTVSNVSSLTTFSIPTIMIISLLCLVLYSTALFFLCSKIEIKKRVFLPISASITAVMVAFFCIPNISTTVLECFNISSATADNSFMMDEKFDDNNLIAFLAQNTTEYLQNITIEPPEHYSRKKVNSIVSLNNKNLSTTSKKPNVITIMSESYSDFRKLNNSKVKKDTYKNFDKLSKQGYSGQAIVSTFGGFTVKSEFEMLFGLPIKSLNSTPSPQELIDTSKNNTSIASYYKSQGYTTSYMHPYSTTYYSRDEIMPRIAFDNVYFQDDFEQIKYREYLDDGVAFKKAYQQLKNDTNPSFIHITTMQNHMPYGGEDSNISQLDYYLNGIAHTDTRIKQFTDALKKLDEPTIVLFVGDHFPLFTEDNDIYEQLDINSESCDQLYEESFFIWSNYNVDYSRLPKESVSLFYLPHLLIDLAGLSKDSITNVILDEMKSTPIYTREYDSTIENDTLDTITYDLIMGMNYLTKSRPPKVLV